MLTIFYSTSYGVYEISSSILNYTLYYSIRLIVTDSLSEERRILCYCLQLSQSSEPGQKLLDQYNLAQPSSFVTVCCQFFTIAFPPSNPKANCRRPSRSQCAAYSSSIVSSSDPRVPLLPPDVAACPKVKDELEAGTSGSGLVVVFAIVFC